MLNVLLFSFSYISGFFLAIRSNPVYAFVLYEAVYFFHPQNRWWGYIVPDLSYSFFVVLLMIALVFTKPSANRVILTSQLRWLYFLIFLYAIASFYAVFPEWHIDALIIYVKLGIIITVAFKLIDTDHKLDLAIWGYIFGSWYISFVAFQTGRNSGIRVEGIGTVDAPDANGIAAAIAPSLVFALYYFWKSEKLLFKLIFAFAGIFIANALVLINSRGSFLAATVGILFFILFLYFSKFQRPNQKRMVIFILIAGMSGGLYIADKTFINRMMGISDQVNVDTSVQSAGTRIYFWEAAWEIAKDHPFGSGFKGFNYHAPFYLPEYLNTGGSRSRDVHSTWFNALSEIGYLGLLSLVIMLISSFRSAGACRKKLAKHGEIDLYFKVVAIQAALLSYAVAMSFISILRGEILHWLILFTACAYNIYVLNGHQNNMKET